MSSCFLQPLSQRTILDFGPWEGREGSWESPNCGRTSQQYQKLISPNCLHLFLREDVRLSSAHLLHRGIRAQRCILLLEAHFSWKLLSVNLSPQQREPRLEFAMRSLNLLDTGPRLDPGGFCSCLGSLCWISGSALQRNRHEGCRKTPAQSSPLI